MTPRNTGDGGGTGPTGQSSARGDVGTYHLAIDRNTRSIVLDLSDPGDLGVAPALSTRAA